MNLYRSLLLSVIVLGAIACGNEKKKDEKEIGKSESQSPLITVDTLVLKKRTFQKQIVCNGKLRAVFKSDLSFDGTGVITAINGSNGGYVKKGEVLATLDMKEAQVELEKSYRAMEKANIDLQDKLIGQGYSADTTGIPTAILRNVKISSGYDNAIDQPSERLGVSDGILWIAGSKGRRRRRCHAFLGERALK